MRHDSQSARFSANPDSNFFTITGIALQIDVEDAVGISHQMQKLSEEMENLL